MKKEPRRHAHRVSNPRSMAWETSVFLICYFPAWLYTSIYNHQTRLSPVVPGCAYCSLDKGVAYLQSGGKSSNTSPPTDLCPQHVSCGAAA